MSISSKELVFDSSDVVCCIKSFDMAMEMFECLSIDPGLHNPLACLWIGKDDNNNIYVFDEYYEKGKDIEYHSKKIKEKCRKWGCPKQSNGKYFGYIDPAANCFFATALSVKDLFFRQGIELSLGEKDYLLFISILKDLFIRRKIFIHPRCENLISELFNYRWGREFPIKKDDHAIDALMFYLLSIVKRAKFISNL